MRNTNATWGRCSGERGTARRRCGDEMGTSLIETLIATAICMVVVFALAGMVSMSTKQSKEMGSTVAQATSLAALRMDILMVLGYNDAALNVGGSTTCAPASCTAAYIDFLDATGQRLGTVTPTNYTSNAAVFFVRRWEVTTTGMPANMKRILVRVDGRSITGGLPALGNGTGPSASLACLKAQL